MKFLLSSLGISFLFWGFGYYFLSQLPQKDHLVGFFLSSLFCLFSSLVTYSFVWFVKRTVPSLMTTTILAGPPVRFFGALTTLILVWKFTHYNLLIVGSWMIFFYLFYLGLETYFLVREVIDQDVVD